MPALLQVMKRIQFNYGPEPDDSDDDDDDESEMGSVLVPAQARRVLHARAVHVQG